MRYTMAFRRRPPFRSDAQRLMAARSHLALRDRVGANRSRSGRVLGVLRVSGGIVQLAGKLPPLRYRHADAFGACGLLVGLSAVLVPGSRHCTCCRLTACATFFSWVVRISWGRWEGAARTRIYSISARHRRPASFGR